uniref:Aquaporin Z n=1 Tax=Candidatus Kentrum sp. TC TaxID=2126339 RepID=A0A450YI90_9GAMM|nr:MAG: aquaporin Z [Candidatus Kentron sp. TC]
MLFFLMEGRKAIRMTGRHSEQRGKLEIRTIHERKSAMNEESTMKNMNDREDRQIAGFDGQESEPHFTSDEIGENMRKYLAESMGAFWLVLGGCGSAVLAGFPGNGIGPLGVSLAFGLTVLTMAYAIGHISGCHLNPAVSIGLWAGGRFPVHHLPPYIVARVAGALVAGGALFLIASGKVGFDGAGFAANGYGIHSPKGYSLLAALATEIVMTMMFLLVILGATDERAPRGMAPIAIGLSLTLIHLVSIPVANTSVNPARSTGVALFADGWALGQLWLFWVAPIIGALIGAAAWRYLGSAGTKERCVSPPATSIGSSET